MRAASIDRLANVVFSVCCVALIGAAALRFWRPVPVHAAREDVLHEGDPDPFAGAVSGTGRPALYVFVSSDCRPCRESLGFYKALTIAASAPDAAADIFFVGMEPEPQLSAYLREGGIAHPRTATVTRPAHIPGTPSLVAVTGSHVVTRSWAGRLNPTQERAVLTFVQRGVPGTTATRPPASASEWLARARTSLSRGRQIDSISGLDVSGTDTSIRESGDRSTPYAFSLSWPDRLQLQIGPAVHLLEGDAYSRRVSDPDRFAGPIVDRILKDPESIKTAAAGMHWHLLRLSLTYLARAPVAVTAQDEGTRDFGQLKGEAIAFRESGRQVEAELVLDPTTAQPLGIVSGVRLVGGSTGESEATAISLFGDYRDVSGVRIPHRIDEWTGNHHSRFIATTVRVTTK